MKITREKTKQKNTDFNEIKVSCNSLGEINNTRPTKTNIMQKI